MPIDSGNLALKGLDDLFSTEENRQEEQREQVQQIPIDELYPFTNHPFKVLDDEAMTRTVESIAQYGVLAPLIARPRPEGGYEIISGHRRQYAAKLAGLETLPVIVRQMSDDAAVILMVDSNLQREHILPSERAFAYKMKLEALKNQGARSDLTSSQVGMKLQALDIVGQEAGDSRNQVHRFIRLTNLRHTITALYAISQSVDRISSQQHRKGHVLPDAGRYAIQREGGRERNPVCLLPHHSHCRSPVPQPHDGQAFSE